MAKQRAINPSKQPTPQPQTHHQHSVVAQQWTGPLPPPAALEHFDRIIPNGADRIMKMIEQEQAHRIAYEKEALSAVKADNKRGHYIGAVACFAAIGGAIYTAHIGAYWPIPIAFLSLPVVAMIKAFMPDKK
jgi:uncharacterized membrane protein